MELDGSETAASSNVEMHPGTELFPSSRLLKLLKMDPDIRKVSTDALRHINIATVLFLKRLASQSNSIRAGRKTLTADDVVSAIRLGGSQLKFLQSNTEVLSGAHLAQASRSFANEDDASDDTDALTEKPDRRPQEAKISSRSKPGGRPAPKSADITTFFRKV